MRGATRVKRAAERITREAVQTAEMIRAERKAGDHIPAPHENFRYRHFLMPTYLDYVARVSWADHAVSLETAACLLQMCEERQPERVLDTGSGYSSYVLRRYAKDSGAEVVSVETDESWLTKTAAYLEQMEVGTAGLMSWADFQRTPPRPFDLIFHDLAGGDVRTNSMRLMTDLITADGHLIFDDMQSEQHRIEAKRVTVAAGRRYFSMARITMDPIDRYAGLSVR
jgi:predicted O-methyltransferase YrrM